MYVQYIYIALRVQRKKIYSFLPDRFHLKRFPVKPQQKLERLIVGLEVIFFAISKVLPYFSILERISCQGY